MVDLKGDDRAITDAAPRSLWHPSQSEYGYGSTTYPDYGLRLPLGAAIVNNSKSDNPSNFLGDESKEMW